MEDPPDIIPCDDPENMKKSIKAWQNLTTAGFVIAFIWILICYFFPLREWMIWAGSILVLILIGILISLSVTNRWCGIFINERKLMSISRVQIALWTLVILSAFFAIFIGRLKAGDPDALSITIQPELWAVMGISGASFVGRSFIAGNKSATEPADTKKEVKKAYNDLMTSESINQIDHNRVGVLYGNNCIKDANFMDMFEGDELRNTRFIDVGKLQMFFFTVIILISYLIAIFALINTSNPLDMKGLPTLSDGAVVLLGISHAGLLGNSYITATPAKE